METNNGSNSQQGSECIAISMDQQEDKTESSTPFLPSRFLCPSNLGALLESTHATTVSLVTGGWKESSVCEEEGTELVGVDPRSVDGAVLNEEGYVLEGVKDKDILLERQADKK